MRTLFLTCGKLAATCTCLASISVALLDSTRAAAQSLLYDNTDHLWSMPHTGSRNILWTGGSTGAWFEAQRFKLGVHDNIASVSIPMARDIRATATGTIRFSIWDDNRQGFPGQEIGALGVLDIDSLPRFDFPGHVENPSLRLVPNPLPPVTFDTPIDDLVPGETYHVVIDYRGLGSYEFGDALVGLSNDIAGTNRAGNEWYSEEDVLPPFEDSDWYSPSRFFNAHQYFQMSVTSADAPYQPIICPVDTTYHQDFAFLGPDGHATTFLPQGWAFSDHSRTSDFDGFELTEQERLMRIDTRVFDSLITDPFPVGASLGGGTPVFNAGVPDDADRALALGVTRTSEDAMLQLVAEVVGGDANSIQLTFDIEGWDAANRRANPGEASFNVALDLDTGNGFEQIIDLGQVTTGATLEPPSDELVNGNEDAYRTSFDSGLVSAHLPEGSLLRVRWMADVEAATQGWVFGLDNVSLGMFAQEVTSLVGDYNGNGLVEQGDLDLVLLNWGAELANPVAAGWTNGAPDGAVDQGELDVVLLNWGNSAASAGISGVPEPGGAALLLVPLLAVALCSRRFDPFHRKRRRACQSAS